MGTPEFSVPILKALDELYDVALVISQPNRIKKKGVFLDTPVAACAKELGLNLIQPEHIKDNLDLVIGKGDILVTAAYGQYVPSKILNSFKKCINVHASLLPLHRGGAPIQRCLMEGDLKTGVTIMEMTKRLDAGRMYAKVEYEIEEDDNNSTLFSKLSILGRDLLLESIEDIYNGKNEGIPQNEDEATVSPNILPEEERIDLNDKTENIINKIRGLAMEPGAYLLIDDIKFKIFKAHDIKYSGNEPVGYVLETKKKIVLKTSDSAIELDLVLYPGKKILSGKDFSNGQKLFIKDNLLK